MKKLMTLVGTMTGLSLLSITEALAQGGIMWRQVVWVFRTVFRDQLSTCRPAVSVQR